MKRYMLMILSLTFIIVLGACSNNLGNMNPFDMMDSSGDRSEGSMMMGHGHSDVPLQHSAGENELKIPSVLQKDKKKEMMSIIQLKLKKARRKYLKAFKPKP